MMDHQLHEERPLTDEDLIELSTSLRLGGAAGRAGRLVWRLLVQHPPAELSCMYLDQDTGPQIAPDVQLAPCMVILPSVSALWVPCPETAGISSSNVSLTTVIWLLYFASESNERIFNLTFLLFWLTQSRQSYNTCKICFNLHIWYI